MDLSEFCGMFSELEIDKGQYPWVVLAELENFIRKTIATLDGDYIVKDEVAIHKTARVDQTAIIKGPVIIGPGCFIGPHSLIRGGVYLVEAVSVGPSCEVKHSLVGKNSTFGHFNFIGDSVIGSDINFEAGAHTANYYNERADKTIFALVNGQKIKVEGIKFGALVGDGTNIGANAVTSPGTILTKDSTVKRLELVELIPDE